MEMNNMMTVAQIAELNPAFSEAILRWWIFNADINGFAACIIKIGGRVYIDRKAFEHWLEGQRVETLHSPDDQ
ncbi:MAG: helix-turn-helix domain-containing protein [Cohaesibacter sp.]|nr:helix-turn-helix domain-containing protein [Cohaesibacter sp.]